MIVERKLLECIPDVSVTVATPPCAVGELLTTRSAFVSDINSSIPSYENFDIALFFFFIVVTVHLLNMGAGMIIQVFRR